MYEQIPQLAVVERGMTRSYVPMDQIAPAEELPDLLDAIARNRDKTALASLFDIFAPRVKGYLRRLGTHDSGIDDLVQDVMLTVWRRAHQFDPAKASVSTWIFTIARNRRIDVFRRENRPPLDPDEPMLVPAPEKAADDQMDAEQKGTFLRTALESLPPEQAILLKMAFFEDKSHGAIAAEMDLPLGTVKSRLRLAATKLRARLEYLK